MAFIDDMEIRDNPYGVFNIKSLDKDNKVIDEFTEENLIVYGAREIMAKKIADHIGSTQPINRFVLGTRGHHGTDILSPVKEGEAGGSGTPFTAAKTKLFSEETGDYNYHISFDPQGGDVVTRGDLVGKMYKGAPIPANLQYTDSPINTVKRSVRGDFNNVVEYQVTIETANANTASTPLAYTEAGLYAGGILFATKTFPARIKEDSVKFIITWSIIF